MDLVIVVVVAAAASSWSPLPPQLRCFYLWCSCCSVGAVLAKVSFAKSLSQVLHLLKLPFFPRLSYLLVIVSARPWKCPLLNAVDASTVGLLLALLVIFLADPNRVTETQRWIEWCSEWCVLNYNHLVHPKILRQHPRLCLNFMCGGTLRFSSVGHTS